MQHQETNIGNEEGEKEQIQDKSIRNPPTEVEVSSDNTAEEYVILDKETAVSEEEATGEDVLEVTDGGKESTEDALNCKEETNEVSLQETNEIVLEETNEIVLEEPNEISLEEPNEISLEKPNEISLEKPNEVSLQETNDTVLEETNEVSLEETNDKEKESCPELKTVVSSISQETIQHNCTTITTLIQNLQLFLKNLNTLTLPFSLQLYPLLLLHLSELLSFLCTLHLLKYSALCFPSLQESCYM